MLLEAHVWEATGSGDIPKGTIIVRVVHRISDETGSVLLAWDCPPR